MLQAREQQSVLWHRLKTPAAVSLACLAATLLIAAQTFRRQTAATSVAAASQERLGAQDDLSQGRGNLFATDVHQGDGDLQNTYGFILNKPVESNGSYLAKFNKTAQAQDGSHSAWALQMDLGIQTVIINSTSGGQAKGILLAFHGCSHSAYDWWHPSVTCPACIGLPEEVAIAEAAVNRGLIVVAFSSIERDEHRCWETAFPAENSPDYIAVGKAWQALVDQENWGHLPHYALGASSGGAFALSLAQRVPLDGVCIIVMAVQSHFLDVKPRSQDMSKSWEFPPTFYIHMERDELTAEGVASNVALFKKQGTPVSEVLVKPRPITPLYFSERIMSIDNKTSAQMYNALLKEGCINGTGYLVENPRSKAMMGRWQTALQDHVPVCKLMNFEKDKSPVFEELNVAWASHELVSDHMDQVLDWFAVRKDGPKLMTAVNPRHI